MAMSFPPQDAPASPQQQGNVNNSNSEVSSNNINASNNGTSTSPTTSSNDPNFNMIPSNDQATGQNQSAPTIGAKRKPSRRANTAERRATHNAVERQRRETLNGRFLDLASLLPNLSQIRRPSKSSIVNSSIAHIQASRRHRLIASRELRMLKNESDALRRELNEWRDRAGLPRVEEPARGDGFGMVLAAELEVISGISIEEEDEEADDGFGVGLAIGGMPIPHHAAQHQQQQQMASYGGAYMDDVDDDAALLGPMYPQEQAGIHQPHHHHSVHHQMHHHQQQQHAMMAAGHDLDDPRVAAMLMKNAGPANPFAHNIPSSAGSPSYPTINTRTTYTSNGNTTWLPSPVTYGAPTHLYTPPATSHGLPTPTVTGTNSNSGSPVGGASVNGGSGIGIGSPVSTSSVSSLSGGASPHSAIGHIGNGERRGSLSTAGNSPGGQSPTYEYHFHAPMQEYAAGVPRMAGMAPSPSFVPSHGGHAMPVQQSVGGGVNGAMMMMMM